MFYNLKFIEGKFKQMLLWMSEEVGNIGKHSQQTNQFNQNNSELHLNNCLITLLLPFATNNSLMSDQMVETKKKKMGKYK